MAVSSQGIRRVGRYLLCDQIGSGGMATIHLARLLGPEGFSRTVAVKQLHPQFAQNPEFVAMFLDEARLAVRIRHGNVISPIDIVATGSELFIVMDYVNGESLAALLRATNEPLAPPIACAILVQVLLGLHAAHEATREQGESLGLVHRDVSPQNILVGQDGVARVLDFGIAKAAARSQTTEEGKLKGKIGYMAPEQLRLEPIDRRADLFTAGIVLWEALTGSGLFVADALGASVELILRGEIAPPSSLNPAVKPELDAVVARALAREPSERFQDAKSMATALQEATAPASTLEVIHWIEKIAGPELLRRAELVQRAEKFVLEDVPLQAPAAAPFDGAGTGQPKTALIQAVTHTARMTTESPAESPSSQSSAPTGDVTGVAMGADRELPATSEASRKNRKILPIFVAASLACAALAIWTLSPSYDPSRDGPAKSLSIDRAVTGSVSMPSSASPSEPRPPLALPQEAPAVSLPLAPLPSANAAKGPAHALRPATKTLPVRTIPVPSPSARETKPARSKRENCNPPWTVNEQNVKIFKEECLR